MIIAVYGRSREQGAKHLHSGEEIEVAYKPMTKEERAVLADADRLGLAPEVLGAARSRFISDLRRDVKPARAMVAAAAATATSPTAVRAPVPVAAASVKSTDKPRPPATVTSNGKTPTAKPRVAVERTAVRSAPVHAATPTPPSTAPTTTPTAYPSFWVRGRRAAAGAGRGHQAATITASHVQPGQNGAASSVHAAGDTRRLIQAEQRRQSQQITTAQSNRAGHYDRHNLIAAAGDNAKRLADAQRADLERMARERAARTKTLG